MAKNDITNLNNKVENDGATSAAEFTLLVNAAIESQQKIAEFENYFVPISEEEYDNLIIEGTLEDRPYFVYEK